ncbi:MAG: DUF2156 domain-containing protein [Victivallaceae bacterium]|nr:DUF2156 domain-containing protein [Victivallaceae bacterium]
MKIDLSGLRPVALRDRALFEKHSGVMRSPSSECCFANLFAYRDFYGYEFVDLGDRLVVYERNARILHYPIGKWTTPGELHKIAGAFADANLSDGVVYDVPEEFLDRHPDCDTRFEIEYDEGAIDYLFSIDKIAACAGPKLRKKYNLVKQFQANWPHAELHKIDASEIETAKTLVRDLNSHLVQCQFLDEETAAIVKALDNFSKLKLGGLILYAENGYPAGISVYSILPSDTVDILFEKAERSVKGAAQTLTRMVAMELRGKAKFMNCEQDYNDEEMRHAKRSLDPERFYKRYTLRLTR